MFNFFKREKASEFQLVLQIPANTLKDFDELVSLENQLIEGLGESAVVDGHDMGQGEANIFIITKNPNKTFVSVKSILKPDVVGQMKAGFRKVTEDKYQAIWPVGLTSFKVA